MAANFKVGETVKLVATIPQGPVEALTIDSSATFCILFNGRMLKAISNKLGFQRQT